MKVHRSLLSYVRTGHEKQIWLALPGEINDWWRHRWRQSRSRDGNWAVEGPSVGVLVWDLPVLRAIGSATQSNQAHQLRPEPRHGSRPTKLWRTQNFLLDIWPLQMHSQGWFDNSNREPHREYLPGWLTQLSALLMPRRQVRVRKRTQIRRHQAILQRSGVVGWSLTPGFILRL